jgi:hypothetical protein
MIADMSWIVIAVIVLAVIGLFVVIKSFSMPPTYLKNQKKREALKKKFREAEDVLSEEKPEEN